MLEQTSDGALFEKLIVLQSGGDRRNFTSCMLPFCICHKGATQDTLHYGDMLKAENSKLFNAEIEGLETSKVGNFQLRDGGQLALWECGFQCHPDLGIYRLQCFPLHTYEELLSTIVLT